MDWLLWSAVSWLHNSAGHRHLRPAHAIAGTSTTWIYSSGGGSKCILQGGKLTDQNRPLIYRLLSKSTDLTTKKMAKLAACCLVWKQLLSHLSSQHDNASWCFLVGGTSQSQPILNPLLQTSKYFRCKRPKVIKKTSLELCEFRLCSHNNLNVLFIHLLDFSLNCHGV